MSDRPMHILYLTMNPNLGASARTLQAWLLLGQKRGLKVSVCLRSRGALSRWLEANTIPFRIVPMPWVGKTAMFSWFKSMIGAAGWNPWNRPSVIHCYEHDLWPFAWPLARVLNVPAICHFHFSVSRELASWMFASRWREPAHSIWTTDRQQADSAAATEGILSPSRQSVVPLGIDLARFGERADEGLTLRRELGFQDEDFVIGCACAFRRRKRVDDYLDLVQCLSDRYPRVKGLLAGGFINDELAYGERIASRVRELDSRGKLKWLGNVDDVEPALHASDVQVSSSEYETFGMSVCEAMACARPVAAYRGGSVAEVLGDAGLIVDTGDLDSLTSAVERLILDATLRKSLGLSAKRRVAERFDPRKSFDQLMSIYESLSRRSDAARPSTAAP